MKKTIIISVLLAITSSLYTQESAITSMQAKGLPQTAIPAKYYFDHQFFPEEQYYQFDDADLYNSTVITPDNSDLGADTQYYVFVVPQPQKPDQDFTFIDLWICDENNNSYRVFHQDANNYGEQMALDIHIFRNVEVRDSVYTDKKTNQRITRRMRKGVPVLALQVQEYTGTVHGIVSTLLIQCPSGKTQLMRGEMPVAVLSPLSNMLMMAEFEMAQHYLITTSSTVFSESPYQSTDDFEFFNVQYFTPTVNIYKPTGELVNSQQLPTDIIDMIR